MPTRRTFLKNAVTAGVAVSALGSTAASYARILGANDRVNVAFMGLGGRGQTLMGDFLALGSNVVGLCDTDSRRLQESAGKLAEAGGGKALATGDFREMLAIDAADVVCVATPDHWHTPGAMYALAAGKNVYIEKPVSHNAAEGELLVKAVRKSGKLLQVGNQQRSSIESRELMDRIHAGEIGDIYEVYTWYGNSRKSIGNGQVAPVPDWLDWDLFQGPAPRRDYRDNVVHYNWHWFWHWGTGETCNNAMHELDVARWAIQGDYPDKVKVRGRRRFYTEDDWEMYDTLYAEYFFGDTRVVWDAHSCNPVKPYGKGRGTVLYGTKGSAFVDRNGYAVSNLDGEVVAEASAAEQSATTDVRGGGRLNQLHIGNFLDVLRGVSSEQHSPVLEGHKSTLMCHLGNVAYRTGKSIKVDPGTGRLKGDTGKEFWAREYEPGWGPKDWFDM